MEKEVDEQRGGQQRWCKGVRARQWEGDGRKGQRRRSLRRRRDPPATGKVGGGAAAR